MNQQIANAKSKIVGVVPPRSLFALIAHQYRLSEPELRHIRTLVPADALAVDVGAWWGPWTYWLSRTAKQVVTCEPVPHLAGFIGEVAPDNVRVFNVALSDRSGEASFWLPVGGPGTEGRSSLEAPRPDEARREIRVRTT
ncbi:MAG TPA: hypothetical protein VLL25_10315, partial [Acidimicrobiales bacterium]|nr:hypothetical protein [Acidimicrobiales bacterium]